MQVPLNEKNVVLLENGSVAGTVIVGGATKVFRIQLRVVSAEDPCLTFIAYVASTDFEMVKLKFELLHV